MELVFILPALVLLLFFIVALGRFARARADVDGAARAAARAASIQSDAAKARTMAIQTAQDNLDSVDRSVVCVDRHVFPDVSRFEAGGLVTVRVTCDVKLSDLGLLGLSRTKTVEASFAEVIDRFRPVG